MCWFGMTEFFDGAVEEMGRGRDMSLYISVRPLGCCLLKEID